MNMCIHDRIVVESSGETLVDGRCIKVMEIKPCCSSH